jgi:hypothetical protein
MKLMYKINYFFSWGNPTRVFLAFLISIVIVSCSTPSVKEYNASSHFTEAQSAELLMKLIPYSAKLPNGYNYTQRFDKALDSFYIEEIKKYTLEKYYFSENDSTHYFLVSRIAPSLYEKRIAIAGKYETNNHGDITNYEEAFWTFKMKLPELEQKSEVLFNDYVSGNDLSKYLPGKTNDEWIEFPDAHSYYNKTEQRWIFSLL